MQRGTAPLRLTSYIALVQARRLGSYMLRPRARVERDGHLQRMQAPQRRLIALHSCRAGTASRGQAQRVRWRCLIDGAAHQVGALRLALVRPEGQKVALQRAHRGSDVGGALRDARVGDDGGKELQLPFASSPAAAAATHRRSSSSRGEAGMEMLAGQAAWADRDDLHSTLPLLRHVVAIVVGSSARARCVATTAIVRPIVGAMMRPLVGAVVVTITMMGVMMTVMMTGLAIMMLSRLASRRCAVCMVVTVAVTLMLLLQREGVARGADHDTCAKACCRQRSLRCCRLLSCPLLTPRAPR